MSEYSYEIDKYIVGVDSNGEDGIGLTIATMKDNELHILGSCYGDNARFIDLLIKENQELKKQQEEFINYMMNTIENITHDETDDEEIKGYLIQRGNTFKEILSKYKSIIGGKE